MVEVVNMYNCKPKWGQPGDIRIDRASPWGNPFPIGKSIENGEIVDYNREECIQRYKKYFESIEIVNVNKKVWNANEAIRRFPELLDAKRLGCWCKPQLCHGDYLKYLIDGDKKNG
jgi:hypothetical protein